MPDRADLILRNFELAAANVVAAPQLKPWNYGWAYENYRKSNKAAFEGPSGPMTIAAKGRAAYESAVNALLRETEVRKRWSAEEMWGLLASMTSAAAASSDPPALIATALSRIRQAPQALSIVLLANVAWVGPPLEVAGMVLGSANEKFLEKVAKVAGDRMAPEPAVGQRWLTEQVVPRPIDPLGAAPVALASWGWGQSDRASEETGRRVRDLVDLCLLLETDLKGHRVYSRGGTNRPGIRGLTLDRGAVEAGLEGPGHLELAAQPLIVQELKSGGRVQWYSAEPLPLGAFLARPAFRQQVGDCFSDDPITNRLRVAARWFAESHYSEGHDDAALALGVALDAMLSGKDALPGSALADRFAMLEPLPTERAERVKTYLSFYKVRSSVAHGGVSNLLDGDFIGGFAHEVQWVAQRLLMLRERFAPESEADIKTCFDELRWGIRSWN